MPSQIESQFVAPVFSKTPRLVLDTNMLDKVSGAGPHGGWSRHLDLTAALQASCSAGAALGPHGGW